MKKILILYLLILSVLLIGACVDTADLEDLDDGDDGAGSESGGLVQLQNKIAASAPVTSSAQKFMPATIDENNTNVTEVTCKDYDGGDNPFDSSFAILNLGKYTKRLNDRCVYGDKIYVSGQLPTQLDEAVCMNETINSSPNLALIRHDCKYGCFEGACSTLELKEPDVTAILHAGKFQHLSGNYEDKPYADIRVKIQNADLSQEYSVDVNCYSEKDKYAKDGLFWSSSFHKYNMYEMYDYYFSFNKSSDLSEGRLGLELDAVKEEDFENLNCGYFFAQGPFFIQDKAVYGGIRFANIDSFGVSKELSEKDYSVYIKSTSQDPITSVEGSVTLGYGKSEDNYVVNSEHFFFNFEPEGPNRFNFNERVPIALSGNETYVGISLSVTIKDKSKEVTTYTYKSYSFEAPGSSSDEIIVVGKGGSTNSENILVETIFPEITNEFFEETINSNMNSEKRVEIKPIKTLNSVSAE